jgi:ribosomal protein S18 acetylase RimI-like enzyme
LSSHDMTGYELNEVGWWAKWVDETVWITKNCYAIFAEDFKDEFFFNRSGFLGAEKVPERVAEEIEREFVKRKRQASYVFVEDGRPWEKLRSQFATKGYTVKDRMLVMEYRTPAKGGSASNADVKVAVVGTRSRGKDIREWTRTYLQAFYGDQRLSEKVNRIMLKVVKDKKASVVLARIGKDAVGCAALYRTKGGLAGAYCIGTAPRFRGRGVAAATVRFLRDLSASEGRKLVLQTIASDSVEGLYLKQGFKRVYSKSLFERRLAKTPQNDVPSGETFGVAINRGAEVGTTKPFVEVFAGFDEVEAVQRMFGPETKSVLSNLKVSMDSPRGYLRVDGETGNIIINPEYLRTGHETHLYLDVLHELCHVRQFREGKELYDRRFAYFERPTEIEAYRVAVEEARRIGMDREEIVEYLRVEWVTEQEFMRFVSKMRIDEG